MMESILDKRYVKPFSELRGYSTNMPSKTSVPKDVEEHYRLNRDKIIYEKLKTQKGIALHGGQNVNLQVKKSGLSSEFIRPTYDYDVYSTTPEAHAKELAQHINKLYGYNFATVTKVPMPPAPFSTKKRDRRECHLYRITTPITPQGEGEADYVYPISDAEIKQINGLKGEALECLITKQRINKTATGKRWAKTWRDVARVKAIIEEKKRRGLQ